VARNNYQALPFAHLLQLWQSLNQQIIFITENIPAEKTATTRSTRNTTIKK
jgi:hypothetical protein